MESTVVCSENELCGELAVELGDAMFSGGELELPWVAYPESLAVSPGVLLVLEQFEMHLGCLLGEFLPPDELRRALGALEVLLELLAPGPDSSGFAARGGRR